MILSVDKSTELFNYTWKYNDKIQHIK
jgi:hypothetical protein